MRKLLGFITVVVILVIAAALALPLVFGMLTQSTYTRMINQELGSRYVKLKITNYRRGWFSSKITMQVLLHTPVTAPRGAHASFTIQQTIQHGPLIFYRHVDQTKLLFAQALITANSQNPQLSGNAYAVLNFRSTLRGSLSINKLELPYDERKIAIAQASGYLRYNSSHQRMIVQLHVKQLKTSRQIGNSENALFIKNYQASGRYHRHAGLWFGEDSVKIDSLNITNNNKLFVGVDGIHLQSSYNQVGETTNIAMNLLANKITLPHESFGPMQMSLTIADLNTAALSELVKESLSPTHGTNTLMLVNALIAHGLSIKLEKLHLSTPHGHIVLDGHIIIPHAEKGGNFIQAVGKTRAKLHISTPRTIVYNQLLYFYQSIKSLTKEQAHKMAEQDLNHWIANKVFIIKDNNLELTAKFHDSKVFINGIVPTAKTFKPEPQATMPSAQQLPASGQGGAHQVRGIAPNIKPQNNNNSSTASPNDSAPNPPQPHNPPEPSVTTPPPQQNITPTPQSSTPLQDNDHGN